MIALKEAEAKETWATASADRRGVSETVGSGDSERSGGAQEILQQSWVQHLEDCLQAPVSSEVWEDIWETNSVNKIMPFMENVFRET